MIYVSQTQLDQVEYLIGQSIQGNHILFDLETVRRVFARVQAIPRAQPRQQRSANQEECYSVEHHIERIIEMPTLAQKRAYLERLDHDTFEKVVITYFNIVENNLFEKAEVRH